MSILGKDGMKSALEASEARVDARLVNFDASVKTGFADLRTSFAELRGEMSKQTGETRADMQRMRADMHKDMVDVVKWGAGVAFAAVVATAYLVTLINGSSDQQAVATPQPTVIVIYTQPASASPPAAQ